MSAVFSRLKVKGLGFFFFCCFFPVFAGLVGFWPGVNQSNVRRFFFCKGLCPYLLKFVDVDLVVNVDVSYRYDQNGIH